MEHRRRIGKISAVIFYLLIGSYPAFAEAPQDILITNAAANQTITRECLTSVAVATVKKADEPIVFVDKNDPIIQQIESGYQLFKNTSPGICGIGYDPLTAKAKDFFLPEKITQPTPLEIVDLATLPLLGGVTTKTITSTPGAVKVGKALTQGKKCHKLLTRHKILHKQIDILWEDYWKTLFQGELKKAWRILREIHRNAKELTKVEKKLAKSLSEWLP